MDDMEESPVQGPIVIGGGAAGLAACLTLESLGVRPLLVEQSDRLGGRLRTEQLPDGKAVDVGFQVLQSAYPELNRWTDLADLPCATFTPGARIHLRGRWRTVADPLRAPGTLLLTLFSGVGTWADRFRVLRLVRALKSCGPDAIRDGHFAAEGFHGAHGQTPGRWARATTMDFLREWGFSTGFIHDFLRPFFSGIFLERELVTPAAQFQYTFRMLATGQVVHPVSGISAWVEALASGLRHSEVRTGCRAVPLPGGRWRLGDREVDGREGVILTVADVHPSHSIPRWNACLNAVIRTDSTRFGRPIIGLLPEATYVSNFHFMEDLEGPEGQSRINLTALPLHDGEPASEVLEGAIADLRAAGIRCREVEWKVMLDKALPRMSHMGRMASCEDEPPLFMAGDGTLAPSLDAALLSGRRAAESWWAWHQANRRHGQA